MPRLWMLREYEYSFFVRVHDRKKEKICSSCCCCFSPPKKTIFVGYCIKILFLFSSTLRLTQCVTIWKVMTWVTLILYMEALGDSYGEKTPTPNFNLYGREKTHVITHVLFHSSWSPEAMLQHWMSYGNKSHEECLRNCKRQKLLIR